MRRRPLIACTLLAGLAAAALAAAPATFDDIDELSRAELMTTVRSLMREVTTLRHDLAQTRLESEQVRRERDELKQFLEDHHEYGQDFAQYRHVRAEAERLAKIREAEMNRARAAAERAERRARLEAARAERDRVRGESDREKRYRRAGFSALGLDVYAGRTGYYYNTTGQTRTVLDYHPLVGFDYRLVEDEQVDFSRMTISGSIINGAEEVRNIGVAITFFDESGNQVGAETIRVNNARPDVPYPFTSEVAMALNRAFSSSSVYVLYADPVAAEEPAP